ncbi:MAG: protein kinase [Acidobacteriota bacterium]
MDSKTTLGPYRLDGRLGSGGMGEVYLATDPRLGRRVAIKTIRREALGDETARRRFRREARLAAGLNHRSIVQIHDIVETEDGDGIVMEWVPGRTLRERIDDGPVPPAEVIRLGRALAEGLAAAHGQGLVHRDLKAENVMLADDGGVKILDFGIAKCLDDRGQDTALTADGGVVGSCHAMSPEQAQGFPVDERSDLFSLGTLLYELSTGVSPFRAETPVQTLTRVATLRQTPARDLSPAVPLELSVWIDRLLEKDPAHRPSTADEVAVGLGELSQTPSDPGRVAETRTRVGPGASSPLINSVPGPGGRRGARRRGWKVALGATLLVVAVSAALLLTGRSPWSESPAPPALALAILAPAESETSAGVDGGDPRLAAALRVALIQGVLALDGLTALAADQVDLTDGTSAQVARALAADEALASTLACTGPACSVELTRVSSDGAVPGIVRFEVPVDDPLLLATSVVGQVRRLFPEARPRGAAVLPEVTAEDYGSYLDLRYRFQRRHGGELRDLLPTLEGIQGSSPGFFPAFLLDAQVAYHLYGESRDQRDLLRALDRARTAAALAPADPQPLLALVPMALAADRLEEAEEALDALAERMPGDARHWALLAQLQERRGTFEDALASLRTAVRLRPSWIHLFNLANLELRQGDPESARDHLRMALDRSPDNFRCRSALAEVELIYGDVDEAVALYEALTASSPGLRELSNLGVARMLSGRPAEAAEVFRRVVESAPSDPQAVLNLADALKLMDPRSEAAADLYRRVLDLSADQAEGVGGARFTTVEAQALAHLGRGAEAAGAAQEALRRQPQDPWVAYEAAVVFALVGDRASALAGVDRARELGIRPRWFRLPWFDSLGPPEDWLSAPDGG